MRRLVLIYLVGLVLFALAVGGILYAGQDLKAHSSEVSLAANAARALATPASGQTASLWSVFEENFKDPLARLLLQLIVIILVTRILGAIFTRFGQPSVIGEITAGILLGPSLLGWLWPQASAFVFAPDSLGILQLFSQIGVCLFMFIIGLELDVGHLRQKAPTAAAVSQAGIAIPYVIGVGAAFVLFPELGSPGTSFVTFALFMGIAMSITAFPVLARILQDRGMSRTPLGVLATACAAAGDVIAWIILAIVVALARAAGLASTLLGFALVVVFVVVMIWGVRPLLARGMPTRHETPTMTSGVMAAVLIFITASALTTHVLGIHALFGAFLAGAVMPRHQLFVDKIAVRLEAFSAVFLLPLFFVFSGLRTHVGLLDNPMNWLILIGIVAIATIGKLGGSMLAAKLTGLNWHDSFALGALMNTRGLVELIALNVGYDLGILPPRIFSMLVLMALITTFMTGPLLNLAEYAKARRRGAFSPARM